MEKINDPFPNHISNPHTALWLVEGYWFERVFFQLWASTKSLHEEGDPVPTPRRWEKLWFSSGRLWCGCDVVFSCGYNLYFKKGGDLHDSLEGSRPHEATKHSLTIGLILFFFQKKVAGFLYRPPWKTFFFWCYFRLEYGQVCSVVKDSVGPLNWQLFEQKWRWSATGPATRPSVPNKNDLLGTRTMQRTARVRSLRQSYWKVMVKNNIKK